MAHILNLLTGTKQPVPERSGTGGFDVKASGYNAVIGAGTPLVGRGLQAVVGNIPEVKAVFRLEHSDLTGPAARGLINAVKEKSEKTLWILECRLSDDWDCLDLMREILTLDGGDGGERKEDLVVALVDCGVDALPGMVAKIGPQAACCLREPERVAISAIRSALEGAVYRSPVFQSRVSEGSIPNALSNKEMATVVAIVQGRSIGEIAFDWNANRKTVSTFRNRALKKLGLRNDAELARYMIQHHPHHFSD